MSESYPLGRSPYQRSVWAFMTIGLVVLAGCDAEEGISHYTVARELPRPAAKKSFSNAPGLSYSVPEGWRETAPRGGFALKSFVTGPAESAAELTVTPLQGNAGGLAANANRWRGQLGLAPLSEEELAKVTKYVEIGGSRAVVLDFHGEGDAPKRTLGVVVENGDKTWFFKLMGPDPAVHAAEAGFESFMKSVRFDGGEAKP